MAIVGAEVWLNNSNYEQGAGDGLYERATNFFDAINWDTLITLASKAHADVSCHLSEKYSLGNFNLVRQIIFADGTLWIVRLRLPGLDGVFAAHETLDTTRAMQVEVATLNYLRYFPSVSARLSRLMSRSEYIPRSRYRRSLDMTSTLVISSGPRTFS